MSDARVLLDPVKFMQLYWPQLKLYDKQQEILRSLVEWDQTVVPAGNMLGKDWISGYAAVWFFCSRSPCKVITSSVDYDQLRGVLWGEIKKFIRTAAMPLPLHVNDMEIRQVRRDGSLVEQTYMIGRVAKVGEGLLGHHLPRGKGGIPRTLFIGDECSALRNEHFDSVRTWAHRVLLIGNCFPCENYFKQASNEGNQVGDRGEKYRNVIRIRGVDSPNVKLGLLQESRGLEVTNEEVIPGVLSYREYLKRLKTYDPVLRKISLDAEFPEDATVRLFPDEWLSLAAKRAEQLDVSLPLQGKNQRARIACSMGVDTGEGRDSTVWTIIDKLGILHQESAKTADTMDIPKRTIELLKEYQLPASSVYFDRGGGGKQVADYLRKIGYAVNTVSFGAQATEPKRGMKQFQQKKEEVEERGAYKNRRAEMYGLAREAINPALGGTFAIPARYHELVRQLRLLPMCYDAVGKMYLPPKDKSTANSKERTLRDLIGRSPDEADSFVLAMWGVRKPVIKPLAGAM